MGAHEAMELFFSDNTSGLRSALLPDLVNAVDLLLRQAIQRVTTSINVSVPRPPFAPPPSSLPLPFVKPNSDGVMQPALVSLDQISGALAPPLSSDEELFALSVLDLASLLTGLDIKSFLAEPRLEPVLQIMQTLLALNTSSPSSLPSSSPVTSLMDAGNVSAAENSDLKALMQAALALDGDAKSNAQVFATEVLEGVSKLASARLSTL